MSKQKEDAQRWRQFWSEKADISPGTLVGVGMDLAMRHPEWAAAWSANDRAGMVHPVETYHSILDQFVADLPFEIVDGDSDG